MACMSRRKFLGSRSAPAVAGVGLPTREQRRDGVKLISELMTAAGLTSVHQTGAGRDDLIAYQDARDEGGLRFRMYLFPRGQFYPDLVNTGVRTGFGDEVPRIGAVKYSAGGAAMHEA